MLIAYVDESGDTGDPSLSGASACYSLGCVLTKVSTWPDSYDVLIASRRRMRDTYGVRMRDELKANYLIRGSGPLLRNNLAPDARRRIYRSQLSVLQYLPARAFAIVTDKSASGLSGQRCFDETWSMLLQRLERTSHYRDDEPIMVIHDEGEDARVRKLVRKARRHLTAGSAFGGGTLLRSMKHLIDDPIPRDSASSYFIQAADLVAYAGWRTYMPPGVGAARVCPTDMWSALGDATHADVNKMSGGTPGVVVRKR